MYYDTFFLLQLLLSHTSTLSYILLTLSGQTFQLQMAFTRVQLSVSLHPFNAKSLNRVPRRVFILKSSLTPSNTRTTYICINYGEIQQFFFQNFVYSHSWAQIVFEIWQIYYIVGTYSYQSFPTNLPVVNIITWFSMYQWNHS